MTAPIGFHRRTARDLEEILNRYERDAGPKLADNFYEELMNRLEIARENPEHFPFYHEHIRRANLKRFPYHFLYEIELSSIWVFVIRHNHRNPSYGMRRI